MLKAIIHQGQIQALEPLPVDWQEGQPLRGEKAEVEEASTSQIDRDFATLDSLCESSELSDEERLTLAIRTIRQVAKEQARRQMGLP